MGRAMKTLETLAEVFANDTRFSGTAKQDEPLFAHTTMHVGGKAALFVEPADENSLLFALHELRAADVPFFILGGGSNVIISDSDFSGAVISTRRLSGVKKLPQSCITVGAGTPWGSVIAFCREHDLGGLEGFTGLSGTAGGAVYMNATCFGLTACDRLVSVRYVDALTGDTGEYVLDDEKRKTDWGYKKSPFQDTDEHRLTRIHTDSGVLGVQPLGERGAKNPQGLERGGDFPHKIILSAQFSVTKGFDAQKSEHCIAQRKEKGHFLAPSAGSVFKNDAARGVIAGKVIDECGLKGLQIGGAQVAPWHGNFMVNVGDATAQDIFDLVQLVKKIVAEKTGVQLECEIIFVGAFFLD